jgi:hypothetical protein
VSFACLRFLNTELSLDQSLFPIPLVLRYRVTFGLRFYQTWFFGFPGCYLLRWGLLDYVIKRSASQFFLEEKKGVANILCHSNKNSEFVKLKPHIKCHYLCCIISTYNTLSSICVVSQIKGSCKVLTSKTISWDKLDGWSMSRLSADAAPDITMQANRFTRSGYFRPLFLHDDRIKE